MLSRTAVRQASDGLGLALPAAALPVVSVIVPARDEEHYIAACVRAILEQDYAGCMELIVVDGMSTDGTRRVVTDLLSSRPLRSGPAVRILDNPGRTAPCAMNVGIAAAAGDVIIRIDGHSVPSNDYVRRCIEVLQATGCECVGGGFSQVATTEVGRAIAAAQSSRFGVGGVAFRTGRSTPGLVDTVAFGAYLRGVFDKIGPFDEELVRNQDDELNFRLVQAGGRVWYDPRINLRYHGRSSLRRLSRQYYQYGLYKVRVAQKRGGFSSPRHLVPGVFVAAAAGSLLAAATTRRARWGLVVLGPYAVANAVAASRAAAAGGVDPLTVSAAFATLHTSYGAGFLAGLWRWRHHFRRARG